MLVSGYFEQSDMQLYLSVGRDVGVVLEEQQAQMQDYMIIYGIILCISAVALSGISFLLTRPIGLLTKAAGRIADGHYSERVYSRSHDEIGMLAQSFNKMAENVEEKIYALELNARQKEDFVANFAHELKTPLTSVIGYADMPTDIYVNANVTDFLPLYFFTAAMVGITIWLYLRKGKKRGTRK